MRYMVPVFQKGTGLNRKKWKNRKSEIWAYRNSAWGSGAECDNVNNAICFGSHLWNFSFLLLGTAQVLWEAVIVRDPEFQIHFKWSAKYCQLGHAKLITPECLHFCLGEVKNILRYQTSHRTASQGQAEGVSSYVDSLSCTPVSLYINWEVSRVLFGAETIFLCLKAQKVNCLM